VQTAFKQALSVMDKTTGDDINAHFETITFSLTGEESRLGAAVEHLRQWRDYRARIDQDVPTNNKVKCLDDPPQTGQTIECVPEDQLEIIPPAGEPVVIPQGECDLAKKNENAGCRARGPQPVADRPPTDFLWQRPPTQLNGFEGAARQTPGHDYLLPYWMLRYYTEVDEPALDPFPVYPGPAHA
jgi:hypothetical protein